MPLWQVPPVQAVPLTAFKLQEALVPVLEPLQDQELPQAELVRPEAVPLVQEPAEEPQEPLTTVEEHEALVPVQEPLHVQVVVLPDVETPEAVPLVQEPAEEPQEPLVGGVVVVFTEQEADAVAALLQV